MRGRGWWAARALVLAVILAVGLGATVAAPVRAQPPGCPEGTATLNDPDRSCDDKPAVASTHVPDLSTIKTPASPAFMVLGLAPSQIQRPTTPTGVAFALAGGMAGALRSSPLESFALDVSPYWLFSHPDLSYADLQGQARKAWFRNASLSAATTTGRLRSTDAAGNPQEIDTRRAAVGLRTTLVPGRQSRAALRCQQFLVGHLERLALGRNEARRRFHAQWERDHPRPTVTTPPQPRREDFPPGPAGDTQFAEATNTWAARARELARTGPETQQFRAWAEERERAEGVFLDEHDRASQAEDPTLTACLATVHERRGVVVEVAGAGALVAPEGDWARVTSDGSRTLTGWLTAGYHWDELHWLAARRAPLSASLLGAVRAQQETIAQGPDQRSWDYGGRLVLAWERYGVSGEVGRRERENAGDASAWRFAVGFDFHVRGGLWLGAVFGQDFGDGIARRPLLALANLEWNIGRERAVLPDTPTIGGGAPP